MADGAQAIEAAGKAAAETAAVVAAIETSAAVAIEHAEARVEAAQQVANQIADAAVATALGAKVEKVESEAEKWQRETQAKISTLETGQETLRNQLSGITAQITEMAAKLLTPQPPVIAAANPSEIVQTEMPLTAEPVENAEAILESGAAPAAETATKVRRRVWK